MPSPSPQQLSAGHGRVRLFAKEGVPQVEPDSETPFSRDLAESVNALLAEDQKLQHLLLPLLPNSETGQDAVLLDVDYVVTPDGPRLPLEDLQGVLGKFVGVASTPSVAADLQVGGAALRVDEDVEVAAERLAERVAASSKPVEIVALESILRRAQTRTLKDPQRFVDHVNQILETCAFRIRLPDGRLAKLCVRRKPKGHLIIQFHVVGRGSFGGFSSMVVECVRYTHGQGAEHFVRTPIS